VIKELQRIKEISVLCDFGEIAEGCTELIGLISSPFLKKDTAIIRLNAQSLLTKINSLRP
jgi:hypothetical protein